MEQNRLHPPPAPRTHARAFLLGAVTMSLLGGGLLWASDGTLFVFKPGEPVRASELNHNFDLHRAQLAALESAVTVLQAKVEDYEDGSCPPGYSNVTNTDASFASVRALNPHARLCMRGADEMVKVGDVWIDRLEASIVNTAYYNCGLCNNPGQLGYVYGLRTSDTDNTLGYPHVHDYPPTFSRDGQGTGLVYSCSDSGARPSNYMTQMQAEQACRNSGKRLIAEWEWTAAVSASPEDSRCVINIAGSQLGVRSRTSLCTSRWGAIDLVGDLWERTSGWHEAGRNWTTADRTTERQPFAQAGDGLDATFLNGVGVTYNSSNVGIYANGVPVHFMRGGSFSDGAKAGPFATDMPQGPDYVTGRGIGFRCARDR